MLAVTASSSDQQDFSKILVRMEMDIEGSKGVAGIEVIVWRRAERQLLTHGQDTAELFILDVKLI